MLAHQGAVGLRQIHAHDSRDFLAFQRFALRRSACLQHFLSSARLNGDSGLADGFCYPEELQNPNLNPRWIKFIPREAMPRRTGMCVVIIVPTFTKREGRDPPVITRIVVSREPALAPHVSGRVHQPGGMQTENDT